MRSPTDMASRRERPPRRRTPLIAVAVTLLVILMSARGVAGGYTDYLWFDSLGITSVWRGVALTQIVLVLVFGLVFFVALLASLVVADRMAPTFRAYGPEDEIVQRYREVVEPYAGKLRVGVAAVLGLLTGLPVASQWRSWLLFRNSTPFDKQDPEFGVDISFFVFRLPFWRFVVDWAFMALILILIVTIAAQYLNGGIRLPQSPMEKVSPRVKAHVSVLLALLALTRAAGYWFDRYGLLYSTRGVVDGAGYTDANWKLPGLNLLVFISLVAFALFLVNIWRKGWALPAIGVGLWLLLAIVVGAVIPALVQQFTVKPAENEKEAKYIDRNIEATRDAMRIASTEVNPFPYEEKLDAADLAANAETVRNIRLWDPAISHDTFSRLEKLRQYYRLSDVDADRYELDGKRTQVMITTRDLNPDGLPGSARSWVNRHLQYTHGYGAVAAPANAVNVDGEPNFTLSRVPPTGTPAISEPRVYFGENVGGYAIANTRQPELDYLKPDGESVSSRYTGKGGVVLSSWLRKAAFAFRFGDANIVLSGQVTAKSRLIFERDIQNRIKKAAPFLALDSDPYPVVLGGRILWVQDAYTTTSRYPYAQRADVTRLDGKSGLHTAFNYVRNSVKVTVDAFDGTPTFYIVDDTDPLARAYAKAFPALFTSGDEVPDELRAHFRYPEDLFKIQSTALGRYHITDANEFYNASDAWDVSQDPGNVEASTPTTGRGSGNTAGASLGTSSNRRRMDPYYLQMRLPTDDKEQFLILQPMVYASQGDQQNNLSAFIVARNDPDQYGQLEVFEMPRETNIDGPALVASEMLSDPLVGEQQVNLGREGSKIEYGNVLMIPIAESLLHVRPMYVTGENTNFPVLRRVIVSFAGKVSIASTLEQAMRQLFGDAPETQEQQPVTEGEPGGTPPPAERAESIADLLDRAEAAFREAEEALRAGDLGKYAERVSEARRLVSQARERERASTATTQPAQAA